MDLPSEWLCSIQLFVLYAGSLASMLTGFLIDGQTSLVSLLLYRTLALEPWQIAFDNDHQLFVEFCLSGFVFDVFDFLSFFFRFFFFSSSFFPLFLPPS